MHPLLMSRSGPPSRCAPPFHAGYSLRSHPRRYPPYTQVHAAFGLSVWQAVPPF